MRRDPLVLIVWGALLAGVASLMFAFPLDEQAVLLLGGGAVVVWLLGALLLLAARSAPEAGAPAQSEARPVPDLSLSTAIVGIALAAMLTGAELGLWLVLIGAGLLALGIGGWVREERARRRLERRVRGEP